MEKEVLMVVDFYLLIMAVLLSLGRNRKRGLLNVKSFDWSLSFSLFGVCRLGRGLGKGGEGTTE